MSVKEIFTCVFKYTQAVEVTNKKNIVYIPLISPSHLACAAKIKERILSHICYRVNINSELGTWSQLSYIGQDVRKIPPVLSKMYGHRVHSLDLSYNCLTSLKELNNFPILNDLVLDNNQLNDSIVFPRNENLHTLSLNKNNITDLELLLKRIENNLPNLRYLSLLGNKACPNQLSSPDKDDEDYQRYRYYVLYCLPNLQFLDSREVTAEERMEAYRRGKFMKVVKPSSRLNENNKTEETEDEKRNKYTPLPAGSRPADDHRGMFGKCRFRYAGKHSEGNRFILNEDL